MSTSVVSTFRWLDVLEKEFDKAFVDLDLLLTEFDQDQLEVLDDARTKMIVLSSCFAQLTHKAQTIFQSNAKYEALVIDLRTEMINVKAERQALEEQNKNLMLQLHTSQLECQSLKSDDEEGEIADTIRMKLEEQMIKQQEEFKENLLSDVKAREYEKDNHRLRTEILNLYSEIYGARLAAKYLDKELAGRIQQIQLLGRDIRVPNHENLWNQLEAEIHLHRHKTIVRACREREKNNRLHPACSSSPFKQPEHIGVFRTVKFHKDNKEALGLSITGGKEHGLPILISEIHSNGPAGRCGELFVGDTILSVNKYDLRQLNHPDAVRILSALKGDITMTVIFLASDETDEEELTETNQLKYQFIPEEISTQSEESIRPKENESL